MSSNFTYSASNAHRTEQQRRATEARRIQSIKQSRAR
jgi:hypothetical protein